MDSTVPAKHAFLKRPHQTILALSTPSLFSLIAEPLTGLIDTSFVAQLGAVPLTALGVGAAALTSIFWIFGFLSIGTQTEVARSLGRQDHDGAVKTVSLALILGIGLSLVLIVLMLFFIEPVTGLLGASGATQQQAMIYIRIRLMGAPAVLITLVGFGALRGIQDMRSPFWIAVGVNVLNVVLDYLFIFGWGTIPAMHVAGAALGKFDQSMGRSCWHFLEGHQTVGVDPQNQTS